MTRLDGEVVRRSLDANTSTRLAQFEAFAEIDSTNSYLMAQAAPLPGQLRVALTDNQTQGRGRHGRTWVSPPGSGLCLSLAYTFVEQPANLPALTLAIGLGAIDALEQVGVAGVFLKWPNDLIASDGKLGGILTETQSQGSDSTTVVTGIGINVDLGDAPAMPGDAEPLRQAVDLARIADTLPGVNALAVELVATLSKAFAEYDRGGFAVFAHKWPQRDWLLGREVTISTPQQEVAGVGAGIAEDGALLIDSGSGVPGRVTSGTVLTAGAQGAGA